MGDLINDWPNWGETGEYPPDGFFYDGGDQVNEKHMDKLWDGIDAHVANLNTALRDRVRDLSGNVVTDNGLQVIDGGGLDVIVGSSNGAYVDGEFTGSVSQTTHTLDSNGTGLQRRDTVYIDKDGNIDDNPGSGNVPNNELKLAEVDVSTGDDIVAIRNESQRHIFQRSVRNTDNISGTNGDIRYDRLDAQMRAYQGGSFLNLITENNVKEGIEKHNGDIRIDEEYSLTWTTVQNFNSGINIGGSAFSVDWFKPSASGAVDSGNFGTVWIGELPSGKSLEVTQASFVNSDGTAVDTDCDLVIATLDNAGGGTQQTEIVTADGTTVFDDVTSGTTYNSGANNAVTVAVGVNNGEFGQPGSGILQDVHASFIGKIT